MVKIAFEDVVWISGVKNDKCVYIPTIFNKNQTKYKNLLDNQIYDIKLEKTEDYSSYNFDEQLGIFLGVKRQGYEVFLLLFKNGKQKQAYLEYYYKIFSKKKFTQEKYAKFVKIIDKNIEKWEKKKLLENACKEDKNNIFDF